MRVECKHDLVGDLVVVMEVAAAMLGTCCASSSATWTATWTATCWGSQNGVRAIPAPAPAATCRATSGSA